MSIEESSTKEKPNIWGLIVAYIAFPLMSIIFSLFITFVYGCVLFTYSLFSTDELFSSIFFSFNTSTSHFKYIAISIFILSFPFIYLLDRSVKKLVEGDVSVKDKLGFSEGEVERIGTKLSCFIKHPVKNEVLFLPLGEFVTKEDDCLLITQENIISSELYVDEFLVSKTTSGVGGSLAGAAVGGVLTGGTGAIIGAIAGKNNKTTSEIRIKKISINIILKSEENPYHEIVFYKSNKSGGEKVGLKEGSSTIEHLLKSANHWQAVFINLTKYN